MTDKLNGQYSSHPLRKRTQSMLRKAVVPMEHRRDRTQDSPVKVFDTYGEAQKECAKWNTGEIVRYDSPDEDFVLYKDWKPKEQKDE